MTRRDYLDGWKNFGISLLTILAWEFVITLPLIALGFVFPDQFQGKASGTTVVLAAALVLFLVWAPLASYVLGPVVFKLPGNDAAADHTVEGGGKASGRSH